MIKPPRLYKIPPTSRTFLPASFTHSRYSSFILYHILYQRMQKCSHHAARIKRKKKATPHQHQAKAKQQKFQRQRHQIENNNNVSHIAYTYWFVNYNSIIKRYIFLVIIYANITCNITTYNLIMQTYFTLILNIKILLSHQNFKIKNTTSYLINLNVDKNFLVQLKLNVFDMYINQLKNQYCKYLLSYTKKSLLLFKFIQYHKHVINIIQISQ
eukprot:TRINITY_DN13661_c0_g3_i1.p1 TRINITY_DN13661_c0_g3~~TRINITY_DN13661_c0_g3_i1.p1  ORF type:complete len:213 (+),score=-21.21 TRINITY_DN13661_c0_g3_i1:47-685(+)